MANILIIEDDLSWQKKISSDIGRNKEENFHIANNIEDAKAYLQNNIYEAIFVDLYLANEETPFESLGKIVYFLKNNERGMRGITPVIVVTAYDQVTAQDLIKAMNTYQGWIWGWQDKATYDGDQVRNTILSIYKSNNVSNSQLSSSVTLSPRETFVQKAAEDYHQITLGMLKEPQAQLKKWFGITQIFIAISLILILVGAISGLFWNIEVGTLTSVSSVITGSISALLLRQLNRSNRDFEASRNKVLEQYKNALKQLYG